MSNTVKLPICPKCSAPIPPGAPQGLCPRCVLLGAAAATEQGVPATATSEIPSIERIAAAFPQLEILELIGRGGMGFVFKARQPHLDRFVALKLLPDKLARDPQFAERFNREGRVLAKLNHPNIVSVFDFGQTGGFYFLLMEYIDGVNLRQAMRAGRFSPSEALSIVPKICEALQYAHEQGILHRDIKPENILLDAKGRVKIADFGIAKLVGEEQPNVTLTNTGAALGTPHYMAPEQLEKPSTVDHRADIYSLGVVFYEMLTGELPIGRFAPPSSKTPVNPTVDEVVFRTLEKDRERRYQSAREMKTQVEHLGEAGAVASGTVPPKLAGADAAVPKWSQKAVWGAVLTGLSLPWPMLSAIVISLDAHGVGGWDIFLATGPVCLPGLAGTILGWMALSDIRAHQGRLRGLPLAVFAALFWPLLVLVGVTLVFPWMTLSAGARQPTAMPVPAMLMLLIPAGTITFAIWAVYAAARWAGNNPPTHRRGVLKWVFLCLLVFGCGIVLLSARHREAQRALVDAQRAATIANDAVAASPMIQFTFTTVELREEEGARWLAMDFVQQTRGDCERFLRYDANVPGFTAQTRTTSFMTDAKVGFAPVLHQRISWKLPNSLPEAEAKALRELVAKERIGKPIVLGPDDEYPLFKTVVPSGGSLVAAIGVKLKSDETSSNAQRKTAPSSKNAASVELWSPTLAPGERPKPSEILQEARSLAQKGRYEEALQRQIWYHNHALEFERSQLGVRLSFALSYWAELARRYPKAKDALVEVRDRGMHEFEQDGGYFDLFMEVAAINRELKEQDATLVLFTSIDARDPKLARQCYRGVEDLLVERGGYSLCARFIPNFQQRFDRSRDLRKRELSLVDRTPEANGSQLRKQANRSFIKDSRTLIEILLGIGRKDEAENIRDQALAVLNVPELESAVDDAVARVEKLKATPSPQ